MTEPLRRGGFSIQNMMSKYRHDEPAAMYDSVTKKVQRRCSDCNGWFSYGDRVGGGTEHTGSSHILCSTCRTAREFRIQGHSQRVAQELADRGLSIEHLKDRNVDLTTVDHVIDEFDEDETSDGLD